MTGPYPISVRRLPNHVFGIDVISDRRWSGRAYAVRGMFTLYNEASRPGFGGILDQMISYQYSKMMRDVARTDLNTARHYRRRRP